MVSMGWTYSQDTQIALQNRDAAAAAVASVETGVDLSALDCHYGIEGDRALWQLAHALGDGRQVFVEFPAGTAQGEMPPLSVPDAGTLAAPCDDGASPPT